MRNVLATFFDRSTPEYIGFWNDLSLQLERRGLNLVLLTHEPRPEYRFANHYVFYLDQVTPRAGEDVFGPKPLQALRYHELNGGRVGDVPGLDDRFQALGRYVRKYVDAYAPCLVLNWCGLDTVAHLVRLVAEGAGIPVAVLERGLFSDSLLLEEEGIFGLSRPTELPPEAPEGFIERFHAKYYASKTEKWPQGKRVTCREDLLALAGTEQAAGILFFAGSNDHSSGAYETALRDRAYSSLAGNTYEGLSRLSEKLAEVAPTWRIIFKPHPKDHTCPRFSAEVSRLSNVVAVTDLDVFGAIRFCDACAVMTSTVMVDAVLMGKPLIVLGRTLFDHLIPGLRLRSLDELGEALSRPVDVAAYGRAVHFLCDQYLYALGNGDIRKGVAEMAEALCGLAGPGEGKEPGVLGRLGLKLAVCRTFRRGWRHA